MTVVCIHFKLCWIHNQNRDLKTDVNNKYFSAPNCHTQHIHLSAEVQLVCNTAMSSFYLRPSYDSPERFCRVNTANTLPKIDLKGTHLSDRNIVACAFGLSMSKFFRNIYVSIYRMNTIRINT